MVETMGVTDKVANNLWQVYVYTVPKDVKKIVEVGVYEGGSLQMMHGQYPQASIVGVDVLPRPEGIEFAEYHQMSQDDPALANLVKDADVFIDDASHDPVLTRKTFAIVWPALKPGALYYLEDWHPDYLPLMAEVVYDIEKQGILVSKHVLDSPPAAVAIFLKEAHK